MPDSDLATLVPLAAQVHKFLQKTGAYDRVMNFLARRTAYPILVLGASGAGKSALLKSLCGDFAYIRPDDRTDGIREIRTKLDSVYLKLLDTPGEKLHNSKRTREIRNSIKYDSLGVINVVSFGYHEGRGAPADAVRNGRPIPAFLEDRRNVEMELLSEWTELLAGDGGVASWVVTAATKADLWWQKGRDQPVIRYYESAPYQDALGSAKKVPHSVKSFSSLSQPFYDEVPFTGHYSDRRRREDHAALIGHILDKASQFG